VRRVKPYAPRLAAIKADVVDEAVIKSIHDGSHAMCLHGLRRAARAANMLPHGGHHDG